MSNIIKFLGNKKVTVKPSTPFGNLEIDFLDSLSKMSGLFNVDEKKTEQLTVWTGFTPEQLEAIKQEKLVAIGEKEE